MTARRTWLDSLSEGFLEVSFDQTFRHLIKVYRKREGMSARQFGELALGDRGFISHRLKHGSSVGLKTADKVLAFMGEPLFGPWFRCEVETFIAMTGSKAHWLGYYAASDPSFVSRLRRGASPRLITVDHHAVRDQEVEMLGLRAACRQGCDQARKSERQVSENVCFHLVRNVSRNVCHRSARVRMARGG